MPLRIEALAGRDSAHISVIEIARPVQHDIDAVTTHAIPPFKRHAIKIFDKKPAHDIDALRRNPAVVRGVHHFCLAVYFFVRCRGLLRHRVTSHRILVACKNV